LRLSSFVATDVGVKRRFNQDNFCTNEELGLYVVADGMGGHAAGEVASRIAVDEISRVLLNARDDEDWTWPDSFDMNVSLPANKLKFAIKLANEKIRSATQERAEYGGMGTTVVAALIIDEVCSIAHVGDSRAYLVRDSRIHPLTSDHSWVNDQMKQGFLTAEHARNHPFRNVITQALGSAPAPQVDLMELPLEGGDLLLLCSDGLNSMLTDQEILTLVESTAETALDELTMKLIDAAKKRGGDDNITVALIRVLS